MDKIKIRQIPHPPITRPREIVLDYLKHHKYITVANAYGLCGIDNHLLSKIIGQLKRNGHNITKVKDGRYFKYTYKGLIDCNSQPRIFIK